ncbi:MAG: PRC-barrel domain-containing protein [Limisphaerales bacterium]
MRVNKYLMAVIAAVGAGSIYAADVEVKASTDAAPKVETQADADARRFKQEVRVENNVRAVNKAHNLIGMEIRNRADEKLGEIKDLVVDMQTGRIAYATLSVGGFLGIGEKLIAVPTSALMASQNSDKYLVMDASCGEIVDAPGIAQTNWPDYRNPNFNQAPFFNPKAHGSAAVNETGRGKLYTDAQRQDHDVKVEANTNRDSRTHVTMGRISSVNGDRVIIDNNGRTETYAVNGSSIRASDYKNGDRVTVKYHTDSNGRMVIDDLTRQ